MKNAKESSGVEELIARLRQQGVEEGKVQADELLEDARRRAEKRLDDARNEAEEMIYLARREAEQVRRAGEEAIQLALRDAVLRLKSELVEQFTERIQQLVIRELQNKDFLKELILELAGRAAPEEKQPIKVLLPPDVIGMEQLRRDPEEVKEGTLSHYVAGVTKEMLRDGIDIGVGDDHSAGIRIQLKESQIDIEFTDKAIAELLLRHLIPRFRAIMEGIIQ